MLRRETLPHFTADLSRFAAKKCPFFPAIFQL